MSHFSGRLVAFSFGLVLVAALTFPAMAQIAIGSLSGVVSDPQGGFIQGAQVTAVETYTRAAHRAVANSEGVYNILSLPSGTYDLTISQAGFQTVINRAILLGSGENKKVDAQLAVGRVSEEVEVTGAAPELQTREGSYSVSEGTKTLAQLPLEVNGGKRDATQYLTALPGFQASAGFLNQMYGAVGGYSELYVDGTPMEISAAGHGLTRNFFSSEAVDEVKVVATPMADLGNVGGIAMSFITKPGTNQLHGSGYDFIRNTAFDARCDQFCKGPKPQDHQGEYGFTLGGPLYIPHVYDGRNKTFWWVNWGHFYDTYTVGQSFYTVPTDAMKGGDFSGFLGPQIGTDPLGNPVYKGEIYNPNTTTTVGGQIVRTPYMMGSQLNMIPTAAFSSVASKYQGYLPEPKLNILPNQGNNYSVSGGAGASPDTYYQIDIDQNIGSKDRISGTYWRDNQATSPVLQLPSILEVGVLQGPVGHFVHLNWTHSFTSNLVHEASFGFDRNFGPLTSTPTALKGAALIGQVNALGTCTPHFQIAGGYMASSRGDDFCNQFEGDNNFSINDNWSLAKGKHLIKWGFSAIRFNSNFPSHWNLAAGFVTAETALPNSTNCPNCATETGNSYASFLTGAVDNAGTRGNVLAAPRSLEFGFYGQDEFKVTRKLTLTYGLRYDVQPFPVDAHDAISQFEANLSNPGCNGCPGALAFLGSGPGTLNKRSVVPTQYFATNFGPKLGFAYQIQQNTVIRGAATVAYAPVDQTAGGLSAEFQQGFFPTFSTTTPDGISPAFQLDNGYPLPVGVSLVHNFDPTIANGSGTAFFGTTSGRSPRVLNTHFGIEHQFPGRVVVGLQYNGSYTHGIITGAGQPLNQLDYGKYASYGQTCLASNITAQVSCPAVVSLPYASFTGTVEQALRPFPQYGDIENESSPTGSASYSNGQVTAKRNFSNGISFLVGYTLSRQFTNLGTVAGAPGYFSTPAQNAYNPKAEKAPAYSDIPSQLVLNYTYQLPIGRGKKLNVNSRVLDGVVGGWSLAGIHTYQSGAPLSISSNTSLFSQATTGLAGNYVRPNVVPGQSIRTNISCSSFNPAGGNPAAADTYLNAGAFVMPGPLQFGNAPRAFGSARSCPYLNENITLYKNFPLTERVNLKFGADFFNILNRHIWAAPDTNFQDPNFGKIFGVSSPRSLQFNARVSF